MPVIEPSRNLPVLECPGCGWNLTTLLLDHPAGFSTAVYVAIESGLPCCPHTLTNAETKAWARLVYASENAR